MKKIILFFVIINLLSISKIKSEKPKNAPKRFFGDCAGTAEGISDCVDLDLYNEEENKLYGKCCYMSYQVRGIMVRECEGFTPQELQDIPGTIKELQKLAIDSGSPIKIYQLDCDGPYIKILNLFFVLFGFLF